VIRDQISGEPIAGNVPMGIARLIKTDLTATSDKGVVQIDVIDP
jgi:hypothetical protein